MVFITNSDGTTTKIKVKAVFEDEDLEQIVHSDEQIKNIIEPATRAYAYAEYQLESEFTVENPKSRISNKNFEYCNIKVKNISKKCLITKKNKVKISIKTEPPVEIESEMNSESAHNALIRIIRRQKEKEDKQDIWKNSPYRDLVKLQSNNVGAVGEEFIDSLCRASGIDADCNGIKTKKIGGGDGDGKIMNISVEIKTAHQGSSNPSFQHELGEVPWKGAKYMIFVDISPECIYLTIFKNFDETTYKSGQKLPCFPTKSITWRKEKGAFKLDTSVNINEASIENGHAIKITPATSNATIASFIRKIIV